MEKMVKFMVVHRTPDIKWEEVEEKWIELAKVETAEWDRTWFNKREGLRYCLWRAPNAQVLKNVFADLDVKWESMLEVLETIPDIWRTDADEYFFGRT
jgi:hypothetical protein